MVKKLSCNHITIYTWIRKIAERDRQKCEYLNKKWLSSSLATASRAMPMRRASSCLFWRWWSGCCQCGVQLPIWEVVIGILPNEEANEWHGVQLPIWVMIGMLLNEEGNERRGKHPVASLGGDDRDVAKWGRQRAMQRAVACLGGDDQDVAEWGRRQAMQIGFTHCQDLLLWMYHLHTIGTCNLKKFLSPCKP